jgi:hypothetical protein
VLSRSVSGQLPAYKSVKSMNQEEEDDSFEQSRKSVEVLAPPVASEVSRPKGMGISKSMVPSDEMEEEDIEEDLEAMSVGVNSDDDDDGGFLSDAPHKKGDANSAGVSNKIGDRSVELSLSEHEISGSFNVDNYDLMVAPKKY